MARYKFFILYCIVPVEARIPESRLPQ